MSTLGANEKFQTTGTFQAVVEERKSLPLSLSYLAVSAVVAGTFAADIFTPAGIALGGLYVFAVIGASSFPWRGSPYAMAAACSALTLTASFIEPEGHPDDALPNKLIAVAILWVAAQISFRAARGRDASERLATIVSTSDDAIIGQTMDGVITSWNKGAERLFGYQPEEVLGEPVTVLFPEDRLSEEDGILSRLGRGARIEHFETVRRRKDGTLVDVSLTISPLPGRGGRLYGASKIARDITARVEAEQRLGQLAEDLARERAALKLSNEDLSRFADIASHDLQEPLRTVRSFADLLVRRKGHALDDEAREYLSFITTGTIRMQRMVEGLLALSRVDTSKEKFEPVDMNLVVRDVLAGLKERLVETLGEVTVRGKLPTVVGDASQLGQLIQNLVDNALKFGGDAPRVEISAESGTNGTTLFVRDEGEGIPEEFQKSIFETFRRLHTDDEAEGSGIGLAIAKKIVERHRGTIKVESKPGVGSTFSFSIPDRGKP